jgi:methyltransferase (TIGR00027 family)
VTVPADLREDWPARLAAAGFAPAGPATWLAEGLTIYLTAGEAERLFGMVGDLSVPGGQLAFEHDPAGLDTMTAAAGRPATAAAGAGRRWATMPPPAR